MAAIDEIEALIIQPIQVVCIAVLKVPTARTFNYQVATVTDIQPPSLTIFIKKLLDLK